jgi:hypothetical protein
MLGCVKSPCLRQRFENPSLLQRRRRYRWCRGLGGSLAPARPRSRSGHKVPLVALGHAYCMPDRERLRGHQGRVVPRHFHQPERLTARQRIGERLAVTAPAIDDERVAVPGIAERRATADLPVRGRPSMESEARLLADRIAAGSSTSANGLPAASAMTRRRTAAGRCGARVSRSRREAAGSRPSTTSSGRPAASSGLWNPLRIPTSNRMGSASSRRPTKARTSADGPSSHCASSAMATTAPSAARSARRFRTAIPTR